MAATWIILIILLGFSAQSCEVKRRKIVLPTIICNKKN